MRFFKNLFKLKFKKIGQNAIKNIKSGQLIKGGGFLGGIINKATNPIVSKASLALNMLGGHKLPPGASTGIIAPGPRPNPYVNTPMLKPTGIFPGDIPDPNPLPDSDEPKKILGMSVPIAIGLGALIFMMMKKR